MATEFNAEEVFEMAEQIERIGAAYYARAAEQSDAGETRRLLQSLADWEKRHKEIFAEMRADLTDGAKPAAVDPYSEEAMYIRALVDGKVFDVHADPSETLTGDEDLDEVFATALEMEKNSILFYSGIREIVPAARGRDKVDDILREEMRHVRLLTKERDKANADASGG